MIEGFEEMIQDAWRNTQNGCRAESENHVASVACDCLAGVSVSLTSTWGS